MIDETTKFNRAEGYYKRDASMGNVDGAWKNFVSMVQEPRNMYADGQLVKNTDNGSRPGYKGGTDAKTGMGFQEGNTMGIDRDLKGKPSLNVEGKNQHTATQKTAKEIQAIIDANPEYITRKNFYEPTEIMKQKGMKKLLTYTDTENPDVVFKRTGPPVADPDKQKARDIKRNLARTNLEGRRFAVKSAEGYQLHHIMPLAGNEKLNTGDYAVVSKEMNAKMSKYNVKINKLVNEAYGLDFNKTDNLKRLDEINNSLFDILNTVKKDLPKEYKGLLGFNKLTPVLDTFDDQGKQILFAEPQGIDYTKSIAGSKGVPVKDVKTSDIQKLVNEAPKSDLKNLMKKIENTDPKLAKKVSIQLNSGIPIDQMLEEIRKIPGIDKLGRGFMKAGGPFEVAFLGLDTINELSKGKDFDESFKTAVQNLTFGAYKGGDREKLETLSDAATELNLDSTGFAELRKTMELTEQIESAKKVKMGELASNDQSLTNMTDQEVEAYHDNKINRLQTEINNIGTSLKESGNFDTLVNNYTKVTKYVAGKQYDKGLEGNILTGNRRDRVFPSQGDIGSGVSSTISDFRSLLPQNFLQNSITKVIPNTLRKLPFGVGSIFEPTSERAKLFDSSKEEKEKRLNKMEPSIKGEIEQNYYSEGGITGLRSKYEYKK